MLPLLVDPLADEAVSSWLTALAERYELPLRTLLVSMQAESTAAWTNPANLDIAGLGPAATSALVRHLDLPSSAEAGFRTGLSQYVEFVEAQGAKQHRGTLSCLRHARYCPQCLTENGGRWQKWWRLPWIVACDIHAVALCERCPECNGQQRGRGVSFLRRPSGTQCDAWITSRAKKPLRCAGDLRTAVTAAAPPAVVATQMQILDFWRREDATGFRDALADIAAVAHVLGGRQRSSSWRTHLPHLVPDAMALLADPNAFDDFALGDVRVRPTALPGRFVGATPALEARVLTIRDPHLRPADRLRYRTLRAPSRPTVGAETAAARRRRMPSTLWRDVAVQLLPPGAGISLDALQELGGHAVALVGTPPGRGGHRLDLSQPMQALRNSDADAAALVALIDIAASLDAGECPIDYERRRRITTGDDLISEREWKEIAHSCGQAVGRGQRLEHVRARLRELLTGDPPAKLDRRARQSYVEFTVGLSGAAAQALLAHANQLLATWAIDEPLEWCPRIEPAESAGHPPDVDAAADDMRAGLTLGAAADRQGIHPARLLAAFWHQPPGLFRSRSMDSGLISWTGTGITLTELNERVAAGESLRSIGCATGISRHTLARRLKDGGEPTPPPGRRRKPRPTPKELATLYAMHSMAALAKECAVGKSSIRRWLDEAGIPIRPRGGASHR